MNVNPAGAGEGDRGFVGGGELGRAIAADVIIEGVGPVGALKVPATFVEAKVIPFAGIEAGEFNKAGIGTIVDHVAKDAGDIINHARWVVSGMVPAESLSAPWVKERSRGRPLPSVSQTRI